MAVDRYPLLVAAVRILFPMTGVLVLSAWALGILNSHRKFLLSYSAPVVWNVAILAFVGGGGLALGVSLARRRRRRRAVLEAGFSPPAGAASPAARCSSWCSCRRCSGCAATCVFRWRSILSGCAARWRRRARCSPAAGWCSCRSTSTPSCRRSWRPARRR